MKPVLALCVIICVLSACVSRTQITAHRDVTIYEESSGRAIGTGETWYEDSSPVWTSTRFRLEGNDCKTRWLTINRSDSLSGLRIVAGFFVLLPWVWAGDYHPSYGAAMECEGKAAGRGEQQQQQQQQQTVIIGIPGAAITGAPAQADSGSGCTKDTDCKGNRVCQKHECADAK